MSYASQVSIPVAVHQQARDLTSDDFPALNGHSSTLPPPGLAAQQQHQQQNVIGGELGGARGILSNGRNNSAYALSEDKRVSSLGSDERTNSTRGKLTRRYSRPPLRKHLHQDKVSRHYHPACRCPLTRQGNLNYRRHQIQRQQQQRRRKRQQ